MTKHDDLIRESIIRDMSEGVMVLGLDGSIQSLNPATERILNRRADQLMGRKIAAAFYEYSENDTFNQAVLDAVYDPTGMHRHLVPFYTGSEMRQLHMVTSYLKDGPMPVGIILVFSDITALAELKLQYAQQITTLLDSLVTALSTAIDERSPYTANHTRNMVKMARAFLDWLDETDNPHRFSEDRRHAFLMSVWLHDVGKLVVPLSIMDKATRLGDDLERVEARFDRMRLLARIDQLEGRISAEAHEARKARDATWLDAIQRINTAPFLEENDVATIQEISRARYTDEDGAGQPVLLPSEAEKLLIRKGTLTDGERQIMQGHAIATRLILSQVKFPQTFAMVPQWASAHHELLGGAGYPLKLSGDSISREVRLLTILDIFEALTAKDRPYKKPIPVERSLDIMRSMVREGSIDGEILALFVQSEAWKAIL